MQARVNSIFKPAASLSEDLSSLMLADANQFMAKISKNPDFLTLAFAKELDTLDVLKHTSELFNIDTLYPFAGHSLGPVFKPVLEQIIQTSELQKQLHAGHFSHSHPDGKNSGNWFDCDRQETSLRAAQQLLGFREDKEFVFSANGLSDNLGKLLDTFFRVKKKDWECGKTKIAMLETEFFSDQAIAVSVAKRAIADAVNYEIFNEGSSPLAESLIIRIKPDKTGIYQTEQIIAAIKENAKNIQVICLPDIVFSTGQRLELNKIFSELKNDIENNSIIVGLDLAHSVGNRKINLSGFPIPITFAVGCGYKHLCGYAGSSLGFYVNQHADLKKYPPLQGWKAADSRFVFDNIGGYKESIMMQEGAVAFRTSNPPPVALLPVQVFLSYFGEIGFDKCFTKSECLTRYLIAQLQHHLEDKIEFITPLDPEQRGATLVFRVKGLESVHIIEEELKKMDEDQAGYEVDVRPPNNIRVTAHYAYTKFEHIAAMVSKLKLVIEHQCEMALKNNRIQS